jgi:hypothetical protein
MDCRCTTHQLPLEEAWAPPVPPNPPRDVTELDELVLPIERVVVVELDEYDGPDE